VLPAFLFSRKRKSLQSFFQLLEQYATNETSVEKLWSFHKAAAEFGSIKTLRSYFRSIFRQIDRVLTVLQTQIIAANGAIEFKGIDPGNGTHEEKLTLLFSLLDQVMEMLHRKNITGILLAQEKYPFLHCFLYQNAGVVLLSTA